VNLVTSNLPSDWLIPLWATALLLLLVMAKRLNWKRLREKDDLNIFLGATVAVLGLWMIHTGIRPGLSFHLLGASALTLMFGPWFALLAFALINAALALWHGQLDAWPINWLIYGALPILFSWRLYRFVDRRLPNHFFIYIFLNAFFGAALAVGLTGLLSTGFLTLSEAYPLDYLLDQYLPYCLLMAWAEAFSTGMLITVIVVYKPAWIATFDDRRYLNR
jgi:uncharacterized membrane protein